MPLVFRGTAHGVLAAFDRRSDGPEFTEEDERLMAGFGASAAAAVATAKSVAEDRLRLSIEASEQERGRWARELHDDTLQGLAGLGVMLGSALRAGSEESTREGVESAIEQIREEVAKLRALIAELRPAALDEIGLRAAVEGLVERTAVDAGPRHRRRDRPVVRRRRRPAPRPGGREHGVPDRAGGAYQRREARRGDEGRAHGSARRMAVSRWPSATTAAASSRLRPGRASGSPGCASGSRCSAGRSSLESSAAGLGTLVRASLPVRHVA